MTYAEAVKRAEWWHSRYTEKLNELGGEPLAEDTEALSVLRRAEPVMAAVEELLEVADLRGDTDLPHPADDPKLWTARMQSAWDDLRAALEFKEKK